MRLFRRNLQLFVAMPRKKKGTIDMEIIALK
jgi:hypothetical protein